MKKLMIGIAGIMAMVASVNAADTEKIKAACQSSDKTVWVEKTQACVPVNPCESGNETIRSLYCQNHADVFYYAVPKGNITTIDVINIYAKYYKDLYCQVSEQNIVEKDGYVFVPCSGKDYVVFKFSASETDSLGVVTDLLCPEGSIKTTNYDGRTYCKNVSHKDCDTVKDIVNGKIYVEWIDDYARSGEPWGHGVSWSGMCLIGEKGK